MDTRRTSTGTALFDRFLQGGYETDAITTIYGPAGAGKTNLALLATIETAKNGKKVIFIDTEGGFSTSRLKQLTPAYKKLLDNIIFIRPTNFEEQHHAIERLKELTTGKIGLIVIDTISMLYRLQRSFKDDDTYNQKFNLQLLTLNDIARTQHIPILLLSQVYQSFDANKVKLVGGDVLAYTSKCLLEIQHTDTTRKAILKKHRSMPSHAEVSFTIIEKGIEEK